VAHAEAHVRVAPRDALPLKAIQELLGHATIEMTMRYAHLSPHVPRDAVKLLDHAGLGQRVGKNRETVPK